MFNTYFDYSIYSPWPHVYKSLCPVSGFSPSRSSPIPPLKVFNTGPLNSNIYMKRLTQLSTHGLFGGVLLIDGFRTKPEDSTPLMSTLPSSSNH